MRIFYSWQSDLPNNVGRTFIETALRQAAKAIASDDSIEVEPRIDSDTAGKTGSPGIDETIMQKILESQAFVADISTINCDVLAFVESSVQEAKPEVRPTPNPNVLFELGYAVKHLGWERVLLVYNTRTGDPRICLPFDLRQRRREEYACLVDQPNKGDERSRLAKALERRIGAIATLTIEGNLEPKDMALEQIRSNAPRAKAAVKSFCAGVFERLTERVPDLRSGASGGQAAVQQWIDNLKRSIIDCKTLFSDWEEVCDEIAVTGHQRSASAIQDFFDRLLQECEAKLNDRTYSDHWFDFWRFAMHMMFVTWIAALLRHENWEQIRITLDRKLILERYRANDDGGLVRFTSLSKKVELLTHGEPFRWQGKNHATLIKKLFGLEGEATSSEHDEFMEADFFLAAAGELKEPDEVLEWASWSTAFWITLPAYMKALTKQKSEGLLTALGTTDGQAAKNAITSAQRKIGNAWGRHFWTGAIRKADLEAIK